MPKTRPVLISVSIAVRAPMSEALPDDAPWDPVLGEFLDMVSDRLYGCVKPLAQEPWFEENCGATFNYLDEANARRCARCGRWATDYGAPERLELLARGREVNGKFLCDECRPAPGELPP